ncbi:MAG: hypothetical protein ACI9YR_002767, partial [Bacteroidia bacterium]
MMIDKSSIWAAYDWCPLLWHKDCLLYAPSWFVVGLCVQVTAFAA